MKKRSKTIICCFVYLYICGFSFALADTSQASEDDPNSRFELGSRYRNGKGVKKYDAEAIKWFRKAVDQGEASAQCDLGIAYMLGEIVPKDEIEAYAYFNLAGITEQSARTFRDLLEAEFSPSQRAAGQIFSEIP